MTSTTLANNRFHAIVSMLLAVALMLGSLTLVGCGNKADEQDNCYGEDMPVINEE